MFNHRMDYGPNVCQRRQDTERRQALAHQLVRASFSDPRFHNNREKRTTDHTPH